MPCLAAPGPTTTSGGWSPTPRPPACGNPLTRFVVDEVEALIALGRIDQAEPLLERFERAARGLNRPSALALAARCHGLIAADRNDHAATDAFERALAEHELSAALATFDAPGRAGGRTGPGPSGWTTRAWCCTQELVDSTHGFEEELISTLQRSSHAVRQMLFDNLNDELGGDGKPHIELRAATLRDFGDDVHARIVNGAINHLLARSELFAALSQRVPSRAA